MNDPSCLAWLDLETTDTVIDARHSAILEVGIVFTDFNLEPFQTEQFVVNPGHDPGKRWYIDGEYDVPMEATVEHTLEGIWSRMDPYVQNMHTVNGLWDEVCASELPTAEADTLLESIIDEVLGGVPGSVLSVAGSGVSWFDMRYLQRHFPESFKRMTYYSYDVGSVRRFLRDLAHIDVTPADPKGTSGGDGKVHRALDDAHAHLVEAQSYVASFEGLTVASA